MREQLEDLFEKLFGFHLLAFLHSCKQKFEIPSLHYQLWYTRTIYTNILDLWNNRYAFSTNLHIRNSRVVGVGGVNSGREKDQIYF